MHLICYFSIKFKYYIIIFLHVLFFSLNQYDIRKKRKDSLETRAILLIFVFEHKMFGVVVQRIHQYSKKIACNGIFCVEMTLILL